MPSNSQSDELHAVLSAALPFLRGDPAGIDPSLPRLLSVLRSVSANECWHKHGTFYAHLVDVHRVLLLWGAPAAVALCGLFHSAYSNSYVNLAIFDPSKARSDVRDLIGNDAERLVHLFCVVPRQSIIHDELLFRYGDDGELREHLRESEEAVRKARAGGGTDEGEAWRRKVVGIVPPEGVTVKHIKTGEDVKVSRRVLAAFLLMTMVDFSDQLFGWQDELFQNTNGRLEFSENNPLALWPGNGKPGLWINSISRMGAVYSLITREEEIYLLERNKAGHKEDNRDEDIKLVIPPVFENCSRILDSHDQIVARDLYWEAMCVDNMPLEKAEEFLKMSIEKNPFVGEPSLVLAQVYLGMRKFEEAEEKATEGLKLVLQWGSSWDKRMGWEAWVAWGRVLLLKAKEKDWPTTSWGILSLGLVR